MLDNVNGMREAQDVICVALSIKKQTSHKKLYALMESMQTDHACARICQKFCKGKQFTTCEGAGRPSPGMTTIVFFMKPMKPTLLELPRWALTYNTEQTFLFARLHTGHGAPQN